jgi:hypothetical protein
MSSEAEYTPKDRITLSKHDKLRYCKGPEASVAVEFERAASHGHECAEFAQTKRQSRVLRD